MFTGGTIWILPVAIRCMRCVLGLVLVMELWACERFQASVSAKSSTATLPLADMETTGRSLPEEGFSEPPGWVLC